jgi:hypothetical protein
MRGWIERFPERFEYELAAYSERGLDFKHDPSLLKQQGRVVMRGVLIHEGEEIQLEVVYPDLFPFLRPEVYAKGLERERHQNPYDGNLCLLDRSTREWSPSLTGAWLVGERVPHLLRLLEAGGEELERSEAPQGEPISTYFPSEPGTAIFVPATALELPEEAMAGSGRIACGMQQAPQLRVRGALVELVEKTKRNRKTRTLARAEQVLKDRFSGTRIPLRWVRLNKPPAENTPQALLAAIEAAKPGFGLPPWERVSGGSVAIAGAVFSEEVRQGVREDAWVFAVQVRQEQGPQSAYLIRGERLSREDIEARLPGFVRLGERRVALAGLGALGSEIAVELAKAGLGTLRGLDFDSIEAGTTVRWVGGLTAVGQAKTEYLRQRIAFDYPYTYFEPFPMRLGGSVAAAPAREESELDVLDRFLDGCDLLVDATAEIGVQQALASEAEARGLRQLVVSATEGARGGLVARIDPNRGGCWHCLQMRLDDGSIPLPAHAEPLTLQPRGCGSLTYRGAGYDLLPISAQAARVVAATLSDGKESEGSVVFVCDFDADRLLAPRWSEHWLEADPSCPFCAGRER